MSLLLLLCWYTNKINTFSQKIYLEAFFGLALACIRSSFVVVFNSQQISYFFSLYVVHPFIVIIINIFTKQSDVLENRSFAQTQAL